MKKPRINRVAKGVQNTIASAAMGAFLLWSVTGSYTLEFISTTTSALPDLINLDIDFLDPETGVFTAEARSKGVLWEVIGAVKGDKLEFELTDPLGEDRIVAIGKIDDDGVLSGRAASTEGEEYEWEATDGIAKKMLT